MLELIELEIELDNDEILLLEELLELLELLLLKEELEDELEYDEDILTL